MGTPKKPTPVVKRVSPRRVQTLPVEGQTPEPDPEPDAEPAEPSWKEGDDRLKADKPPHY